MLNGSIADTDDGGLPQAPQVRRRWTNIGFALAVVVAIISIVGWSIYATQIAPYRRPVISVDGHLLTMAYFLARLGASTDDPLQMLDRLAREEILAIEAPRDPFYVAISDAEVEDYVRRMAPRCGEPPSDDHPAVGYRQQRVERRMSRDDCLRAARVQRLRLRMAGRLAPRLPATTPQVHLHMLAVRSLDEADGLRRRLASAEDFANLAAQFSIDSQTRDTGGDMGWTPRSAVSESLAEVVFDQLAIGEVSQPLSRIDAPGFVLVRVSDKAAARPIDGEMAARIGARRLDNWLDREYSRHAIVLFGLTSGYDSKTDEWVRRQVGPVR